MDHVMLDLETMGRSTRSAILSIGAVFFAPETGELGPRFYSNVNLADCQLFGLEIEADTIMWWLDQDEDARRALFDPPPDGLLNVLHSFRAFYWGGSAKRVWSNGATFDIPILANAYEKVQGADAPWHYRDARDMRTVMDLAYPDEKPSDLIERVTMTHHALEDALYQAQLVCAAYAKLGLTKPSVEA